MESYEKYPFAGKLREKQSFEVESKEKHVIRAKVVSVRTLISGLSACLAHVAISVIVQSSDQIKFKLISQLIKSILRVIQKLLKYCNGTTVSTSFSLLSFDVLPVMPVLNLKDSKPYRITWLITVIILYYLMF